MAVESQDTWFHGSTRWYHRAVALSAQLFLLGILTSPLPSLHRSLFGGFAFILLLFRQIDKMYRED